jgi:hypothetical protein
VRATPSVPFDQDYNFAFSVPAGESVGVARPVTENVKCYNERKIQVSVSVKETPAIGSKMPESEPLSKGDASN